MPPGAGRGAAADGDDDGAGGLPAGRHATDGTGICPGPAPAHCQGALYNNCMCGQGCFHEPSIRRNELDESRGSDLKQQHVLSRRPSATTRRQGARRPPRRRRRRRQGRNWERQLRGRHRRRRRPARASASRASTWRSPTACPRRSPTRRQQRSRRSSRPCGCAAKQATSQQSPNP